MEGKSKNEAHYATPKKSFSFRFSEVASGDFLDSPRFQVHTDIHTYTHTYFTHTHLHSHIHTRSLAYAHHSHTVYM